ncbi:MAG: hypothetical protein N2C14_11120, partial [Planctomycetales bacterium]
MVDLLFQLLFHFGADFLNGRYRIANLIQQVVRLIDAAVVSQGFDVFQRPGRLSLEKHFHHADVLGFATQELHAGNGMVWFL